MSRISIPPPLSLSLSPPSPPLLPCQMPMIHVRSVYTSCCSLAFLPPSHSYLILTVFSNSLTFLCSPLISSSSSPTVFPPPSCASQITVFAADTFIAVRPIELEEGATPIRVTLSLPPFIPPRGILPSFLLQQLSEIHHFLHPCQVNHLIPSVLPSDLFHVLL